MPEDNEQEADREQPWVIVRTFSGMEAAFAAQQARITLTGHDIESQLLDMMTASIDPMLGSAAMVRLQVRADDAEDARALLSEGEPPARRRRTARPLLGGIAGFLFATAILTVFADAGQGGLKLLLLAASIALGVKLGRTLDHDVCTKCGAVAEPSAAECGGCGRTFGG